jgi:protein-S-isoprenylcysteine O-methyltransferase Ste14
MSNDSIFRIVLLAGFLVLISFAGYHRVRSQATRERLDRRQEGLFILITLRLFGALVWIGFIVYLINPNWMAWATLPLPGWIRLAGGGFELISILLLIWTLRSLGKNLTDTVVTRKEHTLVISGPYRWVRHPFYCSVALIVLGVSLLTANWFFFVAGGLVFVLQVIRTAKEEQNLVARFGEEYQRYMRNTGRFLPRLLHPH